jgi:uncharacterized protein involved in exopolysaccharide biosynthesis
MAETEKNQLSFIDIIIATRDMYRFLLSKWLIISVVGITSGVCGIVYAWLKTPTYTAEMTFVLDSEKSSGGLGAYAGIAAQFGLDLGTAGGGAFEGDNLIEFLYSNLLIEKTLRTPSGNGKNLFIDDYLINHEYVKSWASDKRLLGLQFAPVQPPERLRDSIMLMVQKDIKKNALNIQRKDKKLSFVIVTMTDDDEVFAKKFVEQLVTNALAYYLDYKSKRSKRNVQILERQVDSIRGLLDGGIDDVAAGNDLNVNPLRQRARTNVQKRQIDVQTNSIIYGEALKNLALAKVVLQKETPLIQIVDQPILPLKKNKPGRLLTGIFFSFITSFIFVMYLLLSNWLKVAIAQRTQPVE